MFYPHPCSIQRGPSTISRAKWRAGTQVCGSTVLTTQVYSTSPHTSLRSTTALAPTAIRTDPFVVTPGSCRWSSSASQWHSPAADSIVSMLFVSLAYRHLYILSVLPRLKYFGAFAGKTGTFLLQKCLPALQWSSACSPKKTPAGGPSRWPSAWKVRSTLCFHRLSLYELQASCHVTSLGLESYDQFRRGNGWWQQHILSQHTENIQWHINCYGEFTISTWLSKFIWF